jgi:TRAP-type C4-dicarboxylate transport system substrate-binding protein
MDFKYAETCKYVTIFNGPVYPFAVVMNMEKWNSLPKDVQAVMDGLGTEQAWWTGNYMDKHVDKSVEWSKKNHNIEIIKLSKKELARWNKLVKPLIKKWITRAKAKGLPARAIVRDIRVAKDYHSRF